MGTVKAHAAKTHFSSLLDRVARGEEITITRYGVPVASLVPVKNYHSKLTHAEIVDGMRALRKRVKPGRETVRVMIAEGRRY